jgi:DNA helicase II / ATP-dependent DNA helicase PcrA
MAVQLLEERPAIAKQFQRVYRFVCVDEFQDTNEAQFRLLCCLVPSVKPNLFVVADDDQLIYQWNGANPKRLQELTERFSMETVQLPENYRCRLP